MVKWSRAPGLCFCSSGMWTTLELWQVVKHLIAIFYRSFSMWQRQQHLEINFYSTGREFGQSYILMELKVYRKFGMFYPPAVWKYKYKVMRATPAYNKRIPIINILGLPFVVKDFLNGKYKWFCMFVFQISGKKEFS